MKNMDHIMCDFIFAAGSTAIVELKINKNRKNLIKFFRFSLFVYIAIIIRYAKKVPQTCNLHNKIMYFQYNWQLNYCCRLKQFGCQQSERFRVEYCQ